MDRFTYVAIVLTFIGILNFVLLVQTMDFLYAVVATVFSAGLVLLFPFIIKAFMGEYIWAILSVGAFLTIPLLSKMGAFKD